MISLVIPTLNESAALPRTIVCARHAARDEPIEIIVSDCSSCDDTLAVAERLRVDRIVSGGSSRADAMNRGARRARGDVLLFLHADSLLPDRFGRSITQTLRDPRVVGGAFDFEFDCDDGCGRFNRAALDWVVMINRIRFRWTGNFYGDQAIFVRRETFERVGGFPRIDLLEDIHFSRRLRHAGRTAILRPPVRTSPRRFLARGVVRQFVEDLMVLGLDSADIPASRIWSHYNSMNQSGHGAFHPPAPLLRWGHAAT